MSNTDNRGRRAPVMHLGHSRRQRKRDPDTGKKAGHAETRLRLRIEGWRHGFNTKCRRSRLSFWPLERRCEGRTLGEKVSKLRPGRGTSTCSLNRDLGVPLNM